MYRPSHFREDRLEVLHALIRTHPFAQLVTAGGQGLIANPLPLLIDPEASPNGTLRGHLARANDQVAALRDGGEAWPRGCAPKGCGQGGIRQWRN